MVHHKNPVSGVEPAEAATSKATAAGRGTLLLDATIAEQQIQYPTYLNLLNQSLEQLERMIEEVCRQHHLHQTVCRQSLAANKW